MQARKVLVLPTP